MKSLERERKNIKTRASRPLSKLNLIPGKHFVVDVLMNRCAQDQGSLPVGPSFHSRENICFASHSSPLVETQYIHKRIV